MTTAAFAPVGGQFELDAAALARLPDVALPGGIWPSTARAALALVERVLPPGPVLLPSYTCDASAQPFRAAGRPVAFYRVDGSLQVDPVELRRQAERQRPAAIVVVAYFGLPVDADVAAAVASMCPRVRVVEDWAQGGLLEGGAVGCGFGDYAITSLRKYLPVPDGAFLVDGRGDIEPELAPGPSPLADDRLAAQTLRHGVLAAHAPADAEASYLETFERAERTLDERVPLQAMAPVSAALLAAADLAAARRRRRENHATVAALLADTVPELRRLLPDELSPEGSPLVLPVAVPRGLRDALRAALARRRVYCPVHWPLARGVDPRAFPASAALASAILGIPIDQRYGRTVMTYVADAVADAWEEVA